MNVSSSINDINSTKRSLRRRDLVVRVRRKRSDSMINGSGQLKIGVSPQFTKS